MGGNVERHIGDDDRDGAAMMSIAADRIKKLITAQPSVSDAQSALETSRIDLGEVEYIRTESLGGQDFKYIQLGEALDTLRALAGDGETKPLSSEAQTVAKSLTCRTSYTRIADTSAASLATKSFTLLLALTYQTRTSTSCANSAVRTST